MTEISRRLCVPLHPTLLSELRAWAREWLVVHRGDAVDADDVVLSMSELVTNASLHGSGPVDVTLQWEGDVLRLAVTDCSEYLPRQPLLALMAEGGRGLAVVAGVSTRWGVRPQPPGGKTVWCEFTAAAVPG